MEADFDIAALFASLGFLELSILILTAFFASVVSGISGYGGGMTLGLLVSPFIPIKLLVPLMSVFVLFSNLSRMYYYRKSIFWKKGIYFAIISTPFLIAGTNFYASVSAKTLYFCLGFGLAFMIDILSGTLTGGNSSHPDNPNSHAVINNTFAIIIDTKKTVSDSYFQKDINRLRL